MKSNENKWNEPRNDSGYRLHVRALEKGGKRKKKKEPPQKNKQTEKKLRLWITPPRSALMEKKTCMESFSALKCGCMRFVVVRSACFCCCWWWYKNGGEIQRDLFAGNLLGVNRMIASHAVCLAFGKFRSGCKIRERGEIADGYVERLERRSWMWCSQNIWLFFFFKRRSCMSLVTIPAIVCWLKDLLKILLILPASLQMWVEILLKTCFILFIYF